MCGRSRRRSAPPLLTASRTASSPTWKQAQTTGSAHIIVAGLTFQVSVGRRLPPLLPRRPARSHCGAASAGAEADAAVELAVQEGRGPVVAGRRAARPAAHPARASGRRSRARTSGPGWSPADIPSRRRPPPGPTRCRPAASMAAGARMKPRSAKSTGAMVAGVALASGWPEWGSVHGETRSPTRAPEAVSALQWIGTNSEPRPLVVGDHDLEDAGAMPGRDLRKAAVDEPAAAGIVRMHLDEGLGQMGAPAAGFGRCASWCATGRESGRC